jgi:hypothetical protein
MHVKFLFVKFGRISDFRLPKSTQSANNKIGLNRVRWYGREYKPVSGVFDSNNTRNFYNNQFQPNDLMAIINFIIIKANTP